METGRKMFLYRELVWAGIADPGTDAHGGTLYLACLFLSFVVYLEGLFPLFFHDGW